jgi:hypothetical protein
MFRLHVAGGRPDVVKPSTPHVRQTNRSIDLADDRGASRTHLQGLVLRRATRGKIVTASRTPNPAMKSRMASTVSSGRPDDGAFRKWSSVSIKVMRQR